MLNKSTFLLGRREITYPYAIYLELREVLQ